MDIRRSGIIHRNIGLTLYVEIYLRNLAELSDGILHRRCQNLPDSLLVLKLNLRLRGMDIDVDIGRADLEINEIRNVHPRRYQPVVSLLHGLMEIRMLHEATVDEEIFCHSLLTCGLGFGNKSRNLTHRRLDTDGQEFLTIATAIDIGDTLA